MGPPADPDGEAAWAAVAATVRPLAGRRASRPAPLAAIAPAPRRDPPAALPSPARAPARDMLDGAWERRLKRGSLAPELTIDLHGHTLAAAHAALDTGLARAIAADARVVLLVAGRMPGPTVTGDASRLDAPLRGIIRASVGDWLHHSRHAARIAAVRPAHPRHGGAGALYVVLRRRR